MAKHPRKQGSPSKLDIIDVKSTNLERKWMDTMDNGLYLVKQRFFSKIAEDMGIVSGTRYIVRLITFTINLTLIFLLPPEGFGIYILAFAFTGLGSKFVDLRIEFAVVKIVSDFKERDISLVKSIIISALKINLLLGTVSTIVILTLAEPIALSFYHNTELIFPIQLAALFIITQYGFGVITATIQGLRLFKFNSIFGILTNLLSLILIPSFILFFSMGVIGALLGKLIGVLFGNFIGLSIFYWHIRKAFFHLNGHVPKDEQSITRRLISFSLPLYLSAVMSFILKNFDSIFLGAFNIVDVAMLQVAFTISGAIDYAIILLSPGTVFLPLFSELHGKGDLLAFKSVLSYLIKYFTILSLPISLMLIIFARPILSVIFPSTYLYGVLVVQILALKGFVYIFQRSECLIASGLPKNYAVFSVIMGGTSLILNIILIPSLGAVGAVISFITANLAGSLYVCVLLKQHNLLAFPKAQVFLISIVVSVLCSGITYLLLLSFPLVFLSLFGSILIGLALYTLIIYKLTLSQVEREFIKSLIKKFFKVKD